MQMRGQRNSISISENATLLQMYSSATASTAYIQNLFIKLLTELKQVNRISALQTTILKYELMMRRKIITHSDELQEQSLQERLKLMHQVEAKKNQIIKLETSLKERDEEIASLKGELSACVSQVTTPRGLQLSGSVPDMQISHLDSLPSCKAISTKKKAQKLIGSFISFVPRTSTKTPASSSKKSKLKSVIDYIHS